MINRDRFLKQPKGRAVYLYQRAIPKDLQPFHNGRKLISRSLGTDSIHEARKLRDQLEKADSDWFDALRAGKDAETIREDYEAALKIKTALGTEFIEAKSFSEAIETGELAEFDKAAKAVKLRIRGNDKTATKEVIEETLATVNAVRRLATGAIERPAMNTTEVFDFWMDKLAHAEKRGKSKEQLRQWRNPIGRTKKHFTEQVKDKPFLEVSRADARRFYDKLNERILAGEITAHTGNREMGTLRKIWRTYSEYQGFDEANPFRNLRWKDDRERRDGYTAEFLELNFLHGDKLVGLNIEARCILLILIETGARPSEVLNLQPDNIVLSADVPHIDIKPVTGRALKTKASKRKVPLVGVAFEAMLLNPNGFPKYADRDSAFSAAVNKYLKSNDLAPNGLTTYSIRHTYEDRMKDGQIDLEMRKQIVGHSLDRSAYGRGFDLPAMQDAMHSIALPFDEKIFL